MVNFLFFLAGHPPPSSRTMVGPAASRPWPGPWVLRLAPAMPWALSGAPGRQDRRLRQQPGSQNNGAGHPNGSSCRPPVGPRWALLPPGPGRGPGPALAPAPSWALAGALVLPWLRLRPGPSPGPLAVRIAAASGSKEPGQGERIGEAPPPSSSGRGARAGGAGHPNGSPAAAVLTHFQRTSNDKKTPAAIVGRGENNKLMERDTCGPYGYTSSSDFAPAPGRVF